MLKYFLAAGALVVAGVPAAVGLSGNASFDRDVPVRVPAQAQTASPTPSVDDDGTADQGPGDRGQLEPGDDNGGATPRDDRTEAGDDRDGTHGHHAEPGDDRGGDSSNSGPGSDDSGSSGGDDRSGSNSGSDDSGSGSSGGDSSGSGSSGSGSSGGGSDDGSGHS